MSVVTSLRFAITSSWDGDGARAARRDLNRLTSDLNSQGAAIGEAAGQIFSVGTALAAFGPALHPIGVATAGVAGGLVAMGAAAASAGGIYAIAMKGAIANALALAAAHKTLTPVQAQFVSGVNNMKSAWAGFIKSTSNITLVAATSVVQGLTAGIGQLAPVVRAVAPIVNQVALAFKNWMAGDGFKGFIALVISTGVPALQSLVNTGRSLLTVLGFAFRALAPLGLQLALALERGAKALASWAAGGGFTRFVAQVQAVAPGVKAFFTALVAALLNISKAMQGLGPLSLGFATSLLRIVAALPPSWIQAIVIGFVAWKAALLGLMVIKTITLLVTLFRTAWVLLNLAFALSPIGFVITLLALLVAAIILVATKTRWFQTAWSAVWNAVKAAAIAVWNALKTAFNAMLSALKTAWSATGNALKAAWSAAWNAIKSAAVAVWNAIKSAANAFFSFLRSKVSSALSAIRSAFSSGLNAIKSIVSSAFNALRSAISSRVSAILSVVRSIPGKIKGALGNLGGLLVAAGRAIINGLVSGIKAGAGKVVSAVKGVLSAARKLLPFSPAKEGPFSGKGWTLHSGRSLMQGFADGVDKGAPMAIRSTSRAMGAVGGFTAPSHMAAVGGMAAGGGRGGGGDTYHFTFTGVNLSSTAELESAVVKAVSDAKRKKRL